MLHIVRGLPGSGKSTFAKTLGCFHVEADMFFVANGVYTFNPSMLNQAHAWCYSSAESAVKHGFDVVVSNTFSREWEIEPYINLTSNNCIYRCVSKYKSIHDIPPEAMQRMEERFEDIPGEILI
jgi:predicted kinase